MKKSLFFLLALAAAACSSDEGIVEPSVSEVKGTPIVVTATTSDDYTKSVFANGASFGQLLWSKTDSLGVYYEQSDNAVNGQVAEKWGVFTLTEGENTNSAKFSVMEEDKKHMVWNTGATKHRFYAYYPESASYNALNKVESPFEKAFRLANNQTVVLRDGESVADAAARNYEDYQILVADETVTLPEASATPQLNLAFKPILSYVCLHVYADNANISANTFHNATEAAEKPINDLSAFYAEGATIYLSRISLISLDGNKQNDGVNLSGDFAFNLQMNKNTDAVNPGYLDESHLGSTRGINIALPGNGLELKKGGRNDSKPVYAVMIPHNLSDHILRVNGLLKVVSADGTKHYYQMEIKDKTGVEFVEGQGYDIYVKATPEQDLTSVIGDAETNNDKSGFIFRTNGKWYSFADFIEGTEKNATFKAPTGVDFAAMGSDLYFVKADGSLVDNDKDHYRLIPQLVDAIYNAQPADKKKPIDVDLSCLQLDDGELNPGWTSKEDPKNEGNYLSSPSWGSVALPEGLWKINEGAFAECTNLKTVTLPNSLTYLAKRAFLNCTSLSNITIPDRLQILNYKDDTYRFDVQVFEGCTGLEYVNLPANVEVTEVPKMTFNGCTGLKAITIPNNIGKLCEGCFSGCTNLSEITIRNRVKVITLDKDAFENVGTGVTGTKKLYVYKDMVEKYKDAMAAAIKNKKDTGWSSLKDWTIEAIPVTAESETPDQTQAQ